MPNPSPLETVRESVRAAKKPLLHDDMRDQPHSTKPATTPGRWSRTLVNFWLDAALLVDLVALGTVATIVQFVFPPGVAARGWTLWGMNYGQWCGLQFGLLAVLGFGVLIHVMLHWTWVCSVVARRVLGKSDLPDDGIRTIYGVGFLILLLNAAGIVVAVALFMIRQPA